MSRSAPSTLGTVVIRPDPSHHPPKPTASARTRIASSHSSVVRRFRRRSAAKSAGSARSPEVSARGCCWVTTLVCCGPAGGELGGETRSRRRGQRSRRRCRCAHGHGRWRGIHRSRRRFRGGRTMLRGPLRSGHPVAGQRQGIADLAQRGGHRPGIREPLTGLSFGGVPDQLVELLRDPVDEGAGVRDVPIDPLVGHRQRRVAGERGASGQHLEQQNPGRVHVAACVRGTRGHLFRRQICGGPQDDTARRRRCRGDRTHQAEIGDLHLPGIGDQHILRLDVTVHQAGAVRHGERPQHRRRDGRRRVRGHRAPLAQQFTQRAALDQFHHQEDVVPVLSLVVHRNQTRMGQPRHRARLELEPRQELGIGRELRIHDLHRHRTVESQVRASVHDGHAAAGDRCLDAVAPFEHRADQAVASRAHPVYPPCPCRRLAASGAAYDGEDRRVRLCRS